MADVEFVTPYGIQVTAITIKQWPRIATITFRHGDMVFELRFSAPQPFSEVTEALEECYQIRIIDNKPRTQQDFGRYQVEIHGEEGCFTYFSADTYEHLPIDIIRKS